MLKQIRTELAKKTIKGLGKAFNENALRIKNDLERSPNVDTFFKKEQPRRRLIKINDLRQKYDVEALESFINIDNDMERLKYICTISEKTRLQTGVHFSADNTSDCAESLKKAVEILKDYLIFYKKLGMSLPDEISICDFKYDGDINIFPAYMQHTFNPSTQKLRTTIYFDKNIFKKEFKGNHKTEEERVINIFQHELVHSRHAKGNYKKYEELLEKGFDVILTEKEQETMGQFKSLCDKYTPEFHKPSWKLNKDTFKTNLPHNPRDKGNILGLYNINNIPYVIHDLIATIEKQNAYPPNERTLSENLLKDFNLEILNKMKLIQKKYETINNILYNEKLRAYAFCNPIETVAVFGESEFEGKILSADCRKLLKELGSPEAMHMSYLPDNHPVIVGIRQQEIKSK